MPDAPGEWAAAAAVAAAIGGRAIIKRDGTGASPSTHDFDIEVTGRRTIALEITTAASRGLVDTQAAVEEKPSWTAPSLKSSWHLRVLWAPTTRVAKLRGDAEKHLAVLEQAGTDEYGDGLPEDNLPDVLFPRALPQLLL